jgi:protein-glutamine gamma-glutamyltransferase
MIQISDTSIDIKTLEQKWPISGTQQSILERMAASQITYYYPSLNLLKFEIKLRSNIVSASEKLYGSGADFAVFKESRCNTRYWTRTEEGGFKLKESAKPAEAINDIFTNGKKYAFECATAIVIVYYKAILDSIGTQNFNQLFPAIFLFDGIYDEDLQLTWNKKAEYLPGDVQYFKNPDYDPKTPQWQGENVVLLENNRYFAHGIGIKTKEEVIASLNEKRKPGATISAYFLDEAARPDFTYLSQYNQEEPEQPGNRTPTESGFTIAKIGSVLYIRI